MSPTSRGRKGRKKTKSTRRPARPDAVGARDTCDCPVCSGEEFDPQQLIDDLLAGAEELIGAEDPLDTEIAGAAFVSIGNVAGDMFEEALVNGFIPQFEDQAGGAALTMLLAIGSVTEGRACQAAAETANRLVEAGIPLPTWAADLDEPVTLAESWRLIDTQGTASMLVCLFQRAGRSHTVVLSVDHLDCGAADEILLFHVDQLAKALEMIETDARDSGVEIMKEALDPAELRWHVEAALDARAVHDRDERELGTDEGPFDDDGLPGYRTLALLLRARMSALPASSKPPAPHGNGDDHRGERAAVQTLARLVGDPDSPICTSTRLVGDVGDPFGTSTRLVGDVGDPFGTSTRLVGDVGSSFGTSVPIVPPSRTTVTTLPTKRKKADGPAPVYQIKVELRGAKPPIWRRLEVPADISLASLHAVIQIAFDWYDSHMHVFETPYGEFGVPESELGHRAEAPVALEQVAPSARSKIRYTYDFGDDWEHDILVEKVLDRDKTASYPRCTGGRRAAPPEDCGGIWGYADLEEILANPTHPEHEERLEWLGLDDATQFDPTDFDPTTVNEALSDLR
ncbi:MAG: plasmid pRiA4b ORF-3 family protein [Pseudonocardiales bacterium]